MKIKIEIILEFQKFTDEDRNLFKASEFEQ